MPPSRLFPATMKSDQNCRIHLHREITWFYSQRIQTIKNVFQTLSKQFKCYFSVRDPLTATITFLSATKTLKMSFSPECSQLTESPKSFSWIPQWKVLSKKISSPFITVKTLEITMPGFQEDPINYFMSLCCTIVVY